MAKIIYSNRFKKDVKLRQKQGKDMNKLKAIFDIFIEDRPIPSKYKDHPLTGKWKGFRDLRIEPDWVLIYCVEKDVVYLSATGSHSNLLKM